MRSASTTMPALLILVGLIWSEPAARVSSELQGDWWAGEDEAVMRFTFSSDSLFAVVENGPEEQSMRAPIEVKRNQITFPLSAVDSAAAARATDGDTLMVFRYRVLGDTLEMVGGTKAAQDSMRLLRTAAFERLQSERKAMAPIKAVHTLMGAYRTILLVELAENGSLPDEMPGEYWPTEDPEGLEVEVSTQELKVMLSREAAGLPKGAYVRVSYDMQKEQFRLVCHPAGWREYLKGDEWEVE